MNATKPRRFHLLAALAVMGATGPLHPACGEDTPPAQPEAAAKQKAVWTKALAGARRSFLNYNDRETAEFTENLLAALDQPDGLSPAALAANAKSLQNRARELIRRGALETATSLNWVQMQVVDLPAPGTDGPAHPNHRTGGTPGPNGLVLYLTFDQPPTAGFVPDESGAGNDGHVYGATWTPEGRIGGAYHFSVTNLDDRIQIPNSDTLNPDFVTVAAWIKTTKPDGFWDRIVDKDYQRGYDLNLSGDWNSKATRGKVSFDDNDMWVATDRTPGDGRWHHVAGTYDGQVNRIYLDGVEQQQKKATHPGPLAKNPWDLCVGNSVADHGNGEIYAYDGWIDEVRIYNRALSAAEIKALASATKAGVDAATPPTAPGAKADPTERLKQVKTLWNQGLINKEDYDKKVKEIMDSL